MNNSIEFLKKSANKIILEQIWHVSHDAVFESKYLSCSSIDTSTFGIFTITFKLKEYKLKSKNVLPREEINYKHCL